jgi:hypothetical protein
MSVMKSAVLAMVFSAVALLAVSPRAVAQTASIEFVARATPTGGLEEPVRGFPFYLLTKSYEDISKEVDAAYPPPDKNAFIDKLDVSKELKEWMKKNHWIALSGEDFTHKLKTADIMDVPEFFKAYMDRNSGDQAAGFPKSKAKPSDKVKDPAKFDKLTTEYMDAIRRYVTQNPMSIDGVDLGLEDINPGPKWDALVEKRVSDIRRQVPHLAQSKYLVARTVTNLDGQGFLRGIPAGTYWLSTLDVAALVGDARPRWDVAVTVKPGETAHVALSSVNAEPPPPPATP